MEPNFALEAVISDNICKDLPDHHCRTDRPSRRPRACECLGSLAADMRCRRELLELVRSQFCLSLFQSRTEEHRLVSWRPPLKGLPIITKKSAALVHLKELFKRLTFETVDLQMHQHNQVCPTGKTPECVSARFSPSPRSAASPRASNSPACEFSFSELIQYTARVQARLRKYSIYGNQN
jgi:hypothetical protein